MKKQSGLTLIELIIVVAIVGIMASIAVPNFGGLMRDSQLRSTYNTFAGDIATARSEAVNRRSPIVLCPSSNGTSCLGGNTPDWSAGYIAYADANRNRAPDAGEVLRYEEIPAGLSITTGQYRTSITIAARGRLQRQGSFIFCKGNHPASARALNLMVTGLGRLATDGAGDNDTTVEDINGNNVTCPTAAATSD